MALVFNERFFQFIVELKVACGQYLEDGVAIVFEVKDIIRSLILDFDIRKSLSSEVAHIDPFCFEPLDDDALAVFKVRVVFLL